MIESILELLDYVKKNKQSVSAAHTVAEGIKLLRRKLWKNAP